MALECEHVKGKLALGWRVRITGLRLWPGMAYGQYFDLDFLAGCCVLGFRGTTARALMTSSVDVLAGSFCLRVAAGFVLPLAGPVFFSARGFLVRGLDFDTTLRKLIAHHARTGTACASPSEPGRSHPKFLILLKGSLVACLCLSGHVEYLYDE
jgi:hypothetical protein